MEGSHHIVYNRIKIQSKIYKGGRAMNINEYEALMMRQERVKDSLRKAQREQLAQPGNLVRPGLLDRAVARVGGMMISAGRKLQARCVLADALLVDSPAPAIQ
jgi:hypothetical protein